MNPVNWFEIPVHDFDKAKRFYESVLGLEDLAVTEIGPKKMAWFPMKEGAPGAGGGLIQGQGYTPSHTGALVYFSVTDIDATLDEVGRLGGRTLVPKTGIGQHGFIAQFEDCEGNRVALHARS
jgi:hypothetical protein